MNVIKTLAICTLLVVIMVIVERTTLPETTDLMVSQATQYGEDVAKATPPKPFVYDGCTFFVDSLLGSDFEEACLVHDIAYWYGGSVEEKVTADKKLGERMGEAGVMGAIVHYPAYLTVRVFGDSFVTRSVNAHWGFGWE